MYLSQTAIAQLYLWAFLTGVLLGAVYDCLRLTRILPGGVPPIGLRRRRLPILGVLPEPKKRRATAVLIFAEDLLFCLVAGVATVLLFYEAFDGKIRVPALGLLAAGSARFTSVSADLLRAWRRWSASFWKLRFVISATLPRSP